MNVLLRTLSACLKALKLLVRPLRRRKVRVAIATLGTVYFAARGYTVSEELMLAIITLGASLALGDVVLGQFNDHNRRQRPR